MIVTTKAKVEAESITFTLKPDEAREIAHVLNGAGQAGVPGYGVYIVSQFRKAIAAFLSDPKISTYKVDS